MTVSLAQNFKCLGKVSTGMATALYHAKFPLIQSGLPKQFLSFVSFPKKSPLFVNPAKTYVDLQLKVTQGLGWSDKDIEVTLKQGLVLLELIYLLGHQLTLFSGDCTFFFPPSPRSSIVS